MKKALTDAPSVVDDLIGQHRQADGSQWINNLDLSRVESWPEAKRGELVTYVMDRLDAADTRERELHPDPYGPWIESASDQDIIDLENDSNLLRKLLNHLVFLSGWPFDLTALDRLLCVMHRTGQQYIDTEPLTALIAAHATSFRPSPDAVSAIERLLGGHLAFWGRGDVLEKDDDRLVVTSLQKLLGNAPLAFVPGVPAQSRMLSDLGTDASPSWISLINHCVTCPKSRPKKAWLAHAVKLLEPIDSEEFTRFSVRWLDALEQPVVHWPNHPGWKIGERTEAWLSGLAWCVSLRPAERTLEALSRTCVTCLKPNGEYGQRSRLLASVCVQAIEQADHPAAGSVLLSLKPNVKNKAVASSIAIAIENVANRSGAATKSRSPAKRRAK